MTNWKYILIIVILAVIVGVSVFYQWQALKEEVKISEIEIPEKITEVSEGTETQLTLDAIKNTEYHSLAYNKTIKLINGSYTEKYEFETASVLSIRIYDDKIAFGDLDNDKREDAVVILTSSGGGTGNFRELAVVLNKDGKPSYLTSKELGDRVIINSVTIKSGIITLDMVVHGPEDGLCCPSVKKIFKYKLSENQLSEIAEDKTAGWKIYRSEKYGFEFRYPTDWKVDEDVHIPFVQLQQVKDGEVVAIAGGISIIRKPISSPIDSSYAEMFVSTSRCPVAAGSRNLSSESQYEEYVYCLTGKEIPMSAGTWKGAVECSASQWYGMKVDPNTCPHQFWIDTKNSFYVVHFNFFEPIKNNSEEEIFFDKFLKGFSFF